jgi:glycosyltransferase involved in cell wall biosynthesis
MKRIFVLYPYYWPDFSAGGPVQSIFNLVDFFSDRCKFFLTTKISKEPLPSMSLDDWNSGLHNEQIYLTSSLSLLKVFQLLQKTKPDTVFINGIFTAVTTLPGLLYGKLTGTKTIVSPRGMLQPWALQKKGWKKMMYLPLFRLVMPRRIVWHATNEKEAKEIRQVFGAHQRVSIATNIPRKPAKKFPPKPRLPQEPLKLVFLSLINSNKNLELVIDVVNRMSSNLTLDIYGPVSDEKYWVSCQSKIAGSKRIQFHGAVPPDKVQEVLSHYHFFILLTVGENFGHAIFDALSIGLPVIISRNTPWCKIDACSAGYYCDKLDVTSLSQILVKAIALKEVEYIVYSKGAWSYASHYLASHDYTREYQFLIE